MLLGIAIKSLLLLGAARLAALGFGRRPAALRHTVWTAAFASLLALPLIVLFLPIPRLPAPEVLAPAVGFVVNAVEGPAAPAISTPAASAAVPPNQTRLPDFPTLIFSLWAAGASISFLRMLLAMAALSRMRRAGRPHSVPDLATLTRLLGIRGDVDVIEGPAGSMPISFGVFKPAVSMPADAASWDDERRRMVLLHELAHVRRRDAATHLMARSAMCLHWCNPLAWSAWREFLKERERAADDLVLTAGARPSEYARHLLEIASSLRTPQIAGAAAVAMARPSQLEGRLHAILDSSRNRQTTPRAFGLVAALSAVALLLPLASVSAQEGAARAVPEVEATIRSATAQRNFRLVDDAARIAFDSGNLDAARKLLQASLAIRGEVSGQQSGDYAIGLMSLGELERRAGKLSEATALFEQSASAAGASPRAVPALIKLGVLAAIGKDYEKAAQYLERARIANPKDVQAMIWLAVVREKQEKTGDAETLFRQAAELAEEKAELLLATDLYGRFLSGQGRIKDAAPVREKVEELRKAQVPPPAPKPPANVHRIGGGVSAPKLISKVEPEFSEEARLARYEGKVAIYTEIHPDGRAHNTRVLRGLGLGLDDKALDAIRQWRFEPGRKDGQAVTVAATIEVNFRLL